MFPFVIFQIHGKTDLLFTMPQTPDNTLLIPQFIKPKHKDKNQPILQSPLMGAPPSMYSGNPTQPAPPMPSKTFSSLPENFVNINKNVTLVATGDLKPVIEAGIKRESHDQQKVAPRQNGEKSQLVSFPSLFENIPQQVRDSVSEATFRAQHSGRCLYPMHGLTAADDPPTKRQKTSIIEALQQAGLPQAPGDARNQLPTVVSLHSPVQVTMETEHKKHLQEQIKRSLEKQHQEAVKNLSSPRPIQPVGGTGISMNSALPQALLQTLSLAEAGINAETRQMGSPQKDPFPPPPPPMLPNIAMMMNPGGHGSGSLPRFPLPTSSLAGSISMASPPLTTLAMPSMAPSQPSSISLPMSLPMSLPISQSLPFLQGLPSPQGAQPFLTTQALSGVPILNPDVISRLAKEGSIHGFLPQAPQPPETPNLNSPQPHRDVPPSYISRERPATEIKTLAGNMNRNGLSEHPSFYSMPNLPVTTISPSSVSQVTSDHKSIRKRHRAVADYETDDRLGQSQSDDFQAASAILMLSKAPVVSPSEKPAKPPVVRMDSHVEKSDCPSIDSAYQSLQNPSITDSMNQSNPGQVPVPFSEFPLPLGQLPDQMPLFVMQQMQQILAMRQGAALGQLGAKPMLPMSLPLLSHGSALTPPTLPILPPASVASLSLSQQHVVSPSLSQQSQAISTHSMHSQAPARPAPLRRSPSPGSDTSSAEVSSTRQSPIDNHVDRPLSLVLRHSDNSASQESVAMELSRDDTWNPIQDTMSRIQEKMTRIEALHREHRVHEKDLSLLMLVLGGFYAEYLFFNLKPIVVTF